MPVKDSRRRAFTSANAPSVPGDDDAMPRVVAWIGSSSRPSCQISAQSAYAKQFGLFRFWVMLVLVKDSRQRAFTGTNTPIVPSDCNAMPRVVARLVQTLALVARSVHTVHMRNTSICLDSGFCLCLWRIAGNGPSQVRVHPVSPAIAM